MPTTLIPRFIIIHRTAYRSSCKSFTVDRDCFERSRHTLRHKTPLRLRREEEETERRDDEQMQHGGEEHPPFCGRFFCKCQFFNEMVLRQKHHGNPETISMK